jgi:hypothetical protein
MPSWHLLFLLAVVNEVRQVLLSDDKKRNEPCKDKAKAAGKAELASRKRALSNCF